ncbi:winged helix-turn-helix domain-containing protein [Flexivirga caeni]|uniref:ArsR family transcriptional regulator n=1 Tax=Flexivirga caeni TaxID=2294115 RepID=A0A3M9LY16_9MICO|nr:winged helix-turn-helix domain-containing protein [Flexivirga caeni]RNI18179.1 ArsR family transcriptional regulator [Flexivirga caeni]
MFVDVDLRNLHEVEFVFARRPFASALLHVAGTAGAMPVGMPGVWRQELHRLVRPHIPHLQLLRYVVPESLSEDIYTAPLSIDEKLRQIADAPVDPHLLGAAHHFAEKLPLGVRQMIDNQPRFHQAAVRSIRDSSSVTREFWPRAATLLDHEERRVDLMRGAPDSAAILAGLLPTTRLDGDWLRGMSGTRIKARLARRVELFPVLAGAPASLVVMEPWPAGSPQTHEGIAVAIGYPLPGLSTLIDETGHALPERPLETLVGSIRSSVLTALDRPLGMGELAKAVQLTPSRATYHVEQLERTGVIVRQRQGNRVVVERTARGESLLNLFGR